MFFEEAGEVTRKSALVQMILLVLRWWKNFMLSVGVAENMDAVTGSCQVCVVVTSAVTWSNTMVFTRPTKPNYSRLARISCCHESRLN